MAPLRLAPALLRALFLLCLVASSLAGLFKDAPKVTKDVTKLHVGVKHRPASCEQVAKAGDHCYMHYTGKLTNGEKFDSSLDRNQPFDFTLGSGQVIKARAQQAQQEPIRSPAVVSAGWDAGIEGMCVGEKRKLKIPSDMGYGDRGSPPKIPGGATLIFDIELLSLNKPPEKTEL